MSGSTDTPAKAGPALGSSVQEVQGMFPSDAALQDALSRLTLAGYDRADFSLPTPPAGGGEATPNQSAADPNTDVDAAQGRVLGSSTAASVAALAAAGATIATGGAAALAIAAAVGAGGVTAAGVTAAGAAINNATHHDRDAQAEAGQLILAVRAPDEAKRQEVMEIMQAAGATRVEGVQRSAGA